jgi:starvation-inducible outer membrane lipoprotein
MDKFLKFLLLLLLSGFILLTGCQTIPKDALTLSPESLKQRQIQTRKYETKDDAKILAACAGLLQDMGFNLDESETELGVIVASKKRSAVNAGQQVLAILAALGGTYMPTDKEQKMRASIVTRPVGENHIAVRVTFQRIVWNSQGQVTVREGLTDPKIYQEFFGKLSKSIFLEAHEI